MWGKMDPFIINIFAADVHADIRSILDLKSMKARKSAMKQCISRHSEWTFANSLSLLEKQDFARTSREDIARTCPHNMLTRTNSKDMSSQYFGKELARIYPR